MNNKTYTFPFYAKAAFILVALFGVVYILRIGAEIILPLIYATLMAILMNPFVNLLTRKKFNRTVAICLVLTIAIVVVGLIVFLISSQLSRFTETYPALKSKLNASFSELITWFSGYSGIKTNSIDTWIADSKTEAVADFSISDKLFQAGHVLVVALLIPVYWFLILYYKPLLTEFVRRVFRTEHHLALEEVLSKSKFLIQSYLTGLLFEMLIVAALNIIGLLLLGIEYAIVLGLIGAILNIIPYLGGIVSTALPMVIAYVTKDSLIYPLLVLLVYTVIQFVDNNFVIPKIVASRVKLNALVSIVVVLVGGALWGIPGMFLAIPLTAILKVIFDHIEPLKPWGFLLGNIVPTTPRYRFLGIKTI